MSQIPASKIAMLCQGEEVYGIGTIQKIYAESWPGLRFICMREGSLTDWLRARGHHVDVLGGLTHFSAGSSLTTLLRFPSAVMRTRRDAQRLHELVQSSGIELMHTFWPPQQLIAGWMRSRGYKVAWQINNNTSRTRLWGAGVKINHKIAQWGADLLLPASDFIASNWNGCGVPMRTIRNAAVPIRAQASPMPPMPIRCLVAGRLEDSKGHHLAVEAIRQARLARIDVSLDIVGGPLENNAYAEQLRAQIANANLSDFVRILGFRSDLRQLHAEYHLGLQCRQDPEPCSLWVCETLVDGLPLIAAANGGTPELVNDGETGLLFKSGSAEDLATKLKSLAVDADRLARMRQAAFERGRTMFLPERFVAETQAAYASIL